MSTKKQFRRIKKLHSLYGRDPRASKLSEETRALILRHLSENAISPLEEAIGGAVIVDVRQQTKMTPKEFQSTALEVSRLSWYLMRLLQLDYRLRNKLVETATHGSGPIEVPNYPDTSDAQERMHDGLVFLKELAVFSRIAAMNARPNRGRSTRALRFFVATALAGQMRKHGVPITDSNSGPAAELLHALYNDANAPTSDVREWVRSYMIEDPFPFIIDV